MPRRKTQSYGIIRDARDYQSRCQPSSRQADSDVDPCRMTYHERNSDFIRILPRSILPLHLIVPLFHQYITGRLLVLQCLTHSLRTFHKAYYPCHCTSCLGHCPSTCVIYSSSAISRVSSFQNGKQAHYHLGCEFQKMSG